MLHIDILRKKIFDEGYRCLIIGNSEGFSQNEMKLLNEILGNFEFDVVQAQALVRAVIQQARFDPNMFHIDSDDEDVTGICPHCINPPMPPLRDYLVWRETGKWYAANRRSDF